MKKTLRGWNSTLKSTTPLKRGAPIRSVSRKRARENRLRTKVLAEMRERDPMCARCRVKPWVDGHELRRRSAQGSITDPANIVGLCREDHRWVTEHPREAIAEGWSIPRWNR